LLGRTLCVVLPLSMSTSEYTPLWPTGSQRDGAAEPDLRGGDLLVAWVCPITDAGDELRALLLSLIADMKLLNLLIAACASCSTSTFGISETQYPAALAKVTAQVSHLDGGREQHIDVLGEGLAL
jgi:hypothetical protein